MTLPHGAADVDTAGGMFLISSDGTGDVSVADLVTHDLPTVQARYKSRYITDGTSVWSDPGGVIATAMNGLVAGIPAGIIDAQVTANYAAAQLAVMNRPIVDLFDSPFGTSLSGSWDQLPFGGGGGGVGQLGNGNCGWNQFGGVTRGVTCRYNAAQTTTDNMIVSTVMPDRVATPASGGSSYLRLYGRGNTVGSLTTGTYAEITDSSVALGAVVGGGDTVFNTAPVTMGSGDSWDYIVGTGTSDYEFILIRNGVPVLNHTDFPFPVSQKGAAYRSVGFGMKAAAGTPLIVQILPGTMAVFSADDH